MAAVSRIKAYELKPGDRLVTEQGVETVRSTYTPFLGQTTRIYLESGRLVTEAVWAKVTVKVPAGALAR